MTHPIQNRVHCRVCGSLELRQFLNLPAIPLIDNYLREETLGGELIAPIRIFSCLECGLAQTQHDINIGEYYSHYQYSPVLSPFTQRFMQRLSVMIWRQYQFKSTYKTIE